MAAEGVVDLLEYLQGSLWDRETALALLSISPSEEGGLCSNSPNSVYEVEPIWLQDLGQMPKLRSQRVEKTLELTQPTELSGKTVSEPDIPPSPSAGISWWPQGSNLASLNPASQQVTGQHPPPPGLAGGSRYTHGGPEPELAGHSAHGVHWALQRGLQVLGR